MIPLTNISQPEVAKTAPALDRSMIYIKEHLGTIWSAINRLNVIADKIGAPPPTPLSKDPKGPSEPESVKDKLFFLENMAEDISEYASKTIERFDGIV